MPSTSPWRGPEPRDLDALVAVHGGVKRGEGLARPMAETALLLPRRPHGARGEETRRLDDMLGRVAGTYEREVRVAVRRLGGNARARHHRARGAVAHRSCSCHPERERAAPRSPRCPSREGPAARPPPGGRCSACRRLSPLDQAGFTLIELLIVVIILGRPRRPGGPAPVRRGRESSRQAAARVQIELLGGPRPVQARCGGVAEEFPGSPDRALGTGARLEGPYLKKEVPRDRGAAPISTGVPGRSTGVRPRLARLRIAPREGTARPPTWTSGAARARPGEPHAPGRDARGLTLMSSSSSLRRGRRRRSSPALHTPRQRGPPAAGGGRPAGVPPARGPPAGRHAPATHPGRLEPNHGAASGGMKRRSPAPR